MEQNRVRKKVAYWTAEEDHKLRHYVNTHGAHHWDSIATNLGIGRDGSSCSYRWRHYLSSDIRRGEFTDEEKLVILESHYVLGNKWSKIAKKLPGRTDNDIKNFWNTRIVKEAKDLDCDINSEEFLHKMRARMNSVGAASNHALHPSNYSRPAQELMSDHYPISDEFWANLGPICDLDDFP